MAKLVAALGRWSTSAVVEPEKYGKKRPESAVAAELQEQTGATSSDLCGCLHCPLLM